MATEHEPGGESRTPLSRERVLRTAVALADANGIESVSMRRLGQELGVEAMSLYNHVANKEEILDGMVDVVIDEIPPPAESADWMRAMRDRALAARAVLMRHPWAPGVIETRRHASPRVMAYMDSVLGILLHGGFSVDLAHHAMHALGSRALGFTQELYAETGDLDESPEVAALMLQQMTRAYPNISRMLLAIGHDDQSILGAGCDDQLEFEFALDLILDGLARLRDRG